MSPLRKRRARVDRRVVRRFRIAAIELHVKRKLIRAEVDVLKCLGAKTADEPAALLLALFDCAIMMRRERPE
jgi:hypothetical protein